MLVLLLGCILVLVTIVLITITFYKWKEKYCGLREQYNDVSTKTRFRKRDKVLFYGRKMLRRMKKKSRQVCGQGKKRKLVTKFDRRLLQTNEILPQRLNVLEPPNEYLEEELIPKDNQIVPPDAFDMLQSIQIFGHFEKPIFLKLCRLTEILNVHAGSHLFEVDDLDEHLFIVQSGLISLNITSIDGSTIQLKLVKTGDSITPLLSLTDFLIGHKKDYKTVSARAVENSTIIRLPFAAFQEVLKDYPDFLIKIIQEVMIRLQRVTFTAFHQYFGLSSELIQNGFGENKMNPFIVVSKNESSMFLQNEDTNSESFSNLLKNDPTNKKKYCYVKMAIKVFGKELHLENEDLLQEKVEVHEIPTNTYVMQENSYKYAALVLLLNGSMIVSQKMNTGELTETHMYSVNLGEIIGGLTFLTGEPGCFTFKSNCPSVIAILSKTTLYSIMGVKPQIVISIAKTVITRLSTFVRQVDFALDWLFIKSGHVVYREGDESDNTFIVLNGRLQSVITQNNGKKELVTEYGRGDLVGIVEIITQTHRRTTVVAVRNSKLAKLPERLVNAIKTCFPSVVSTLIGLLDNRILGTWQKLTIGKTLDTRSTQSNFSTVAVVPLSDEIPIISFTYELYHSLHAIGSTIRFTSDYVRNVLGKNIMDYKNEYHLTTWLAQQEDQHNFALYQCDFTFSSWTQRCIRQADCILLITLGNKQPTLGKYEKDIKRLALRTQKELVLLYKEDSDLPSNTAACLNIRSWVSSHHHIQCRKHIFSKRSRSVISEQYEKILKTEVNILSDFSRLARRLTGTSVGLVLGGGGARGAAHIGMIKAILEAGIPIDMVGGVSIGAFVGAIWCGERDIIGMIQKTHQWTKSITRWWRQILDLTYPVTSMFTGKHFNLNLISALGETQIEDLWLPYFTITTDISVSEMRVHTHGSLWRYVRSSMSLSGYMPPLCDPIDGHLLLDGGYINNLPADVMRSFGAKYVLAIDVGSQDDMEFTNYGDSLSGFWVLWKKLNPFTTAVKVPSLPDIQSRLAYISCVRQLSLVKNSDCYEYIRPPIDKYNTFQFGSFEEIKEVGYQYGKIHLASLKQAGKIPFEKPKLNP